MGFATPAAFWGLLALGALVLLSFWRMRPARIVVPSIALWRELPDRVPPVRSLRRPRWNTSLLLQMLAVASGIVALAGPFGEVQAPKPRRVAIVVDLSGRMKLRVGAAEEAYRKLRAALPADDTVVTYTFPPLARHEGAFDGWEAAECAGDPSLALELAQREGELTFFIGDRAVSARCEQILVGAPTPNTGVIDANIDRGKVWVRILSPEGERVNLFAPAEEIRVAQDAFPLDDVLYLDRRARPVEVAMEGLRHAAIRRALERLPNVRLVQGGRPDVVVRVGQAARPDDPPARVLVNPPGDGPAFRPTSVALSKHPLFDSVKGEEVRLGDAREVQGDTPLMYADRGKVIAALRGREIVIGASIPQDGWPAFPSFPIFWANVLEFLSGGSQEWVVRRTCEPVELSDGRIVQPSKAGENRFGSEIVHANPLDRRVSDLSGESRPFDASRLPVPPMEPRRRDWSAWPAVLALLLVSLSWLWERKAD